ncbi:cupin domain-containing protein [Halomonas organivorans]
MYLSADDIAALEGVTKQHFLNERAIRVNKSLGDAVGLQRLGVHLIRVAPGHYSTEYHAHHYEEECLYVLSGQGLATLGERRQAVGPGDFIGCPTNGVAHDLYNDGDEPLTCLVIGQRLDQDVSDYPRQGKRLYRNSGDWNLVDHSDIETIGR